MSPIAQKRLLFRMHWPDAFLKPRLTPVLLPGGACDVTFIVIIVTLCLSTTAIHSALSSSPRLYPAPIPAPTRALPLSSSGAQQLHSFQGHHPQEVDACAAGEARWVTRGRGRWGGQLLLQTHPITITILAPCQSVTRYLLLSKHP